MSKAAQLIGQAASCRDLARRARRLAGTFIDGPDSERLLTYADELELQAANVEKQAAVSG